MTNRDIFRFCLYIADDTLNSRQAVDNLHAICNTYLPGKHKIELVNVFKDPDRALKERVFMTPTLVKLAPAPVERVVGNLSHTNLVLQAVGLGKLIT